MLSDAQIYELTARAEAALGASAGNHSPLSVAALQQELGLFYCYAGAGSAPDAAQRAAACFAAAADGVAALEPDMGSYVALLRRLAADPPMGSEAAAAARAEALELAARERNFLG